jgi:geranylgeranyl pyrophosphate synthase
LVDDLLDLTSTQDVLGKPVASDLKEPKMTLPVFFAICNAKPEDTIKVQKVLDEREFRSVDRAEILRLVERSDGLERTRDLAKQYASRAVQLLEEFPASVYRDAMLRIPEFILNRTA